MSLQVGEAKVNFYTFAVDVCTSLDSKNISNTQKHGYM